MTDIQELNRAVTLAVQAVAPIDGIRFPDINDKSTWLIWFKPEATQEQREAAQAVLLLEWV